MCTKVCQKNLQMIDLNRASRKSKIFLALALAFARMQEKKQEQYQVKIFPARAR